MRVVDSCGWLEFFKGGPLEQAYGELLASEGVLVPAVVVYEVYRTVRRQVSEQAAGTAVALLRRSEVVDLDDGLAVLAAELSIEHHLAMADAMVYATAVQYDAELVTSDSDLAGLPGVTYLERPS